MSVSFLANRDNLGQILDLQPAKSFRYGAAEVPTFAFSIRIGWSAVVSVDCYPWTTTVPLLVTCWFFCFSAKGFVMMVCFAKRCCPASVVFALIGLTLVVTQVGCLGLAANLINAVKGHSIEAEFAGLKEKRVAVVTITDSSQYSDDASARILSRRVADILQVEVKKIDIVREDEVQQWRDRNGWDAIEFIDIGKGVKADKVVAIEMTNLKLRDGATLYRGRATVTTTVYDVASGKAEFRRHLDEFTYPETAGQYTSETTEAKFRTLYLGVLATKLARFFHPYDFSDTVALDATIINQ